MENKVTLTKTVSGEESEDVSMIIKIQTLDSIYPLTVKRNSTVTELKEQISENLNVPINKQRLIFQGKLLQANETLKHYKISDENVVHLVAKTIDENAPQEGANTTTSNTANISGSGTEGNRTNLEDMLTTFLEIPIATRPRRPRRRRVPHFDISESFESMHQNISTIQNLQQCKNKFDETQTLANKTITPFDLNRSKFEVGQWIDVKDTIDQWLEAQVVQVRNNQVYVHYNGWGTRWDEWIDFSSPRIASFKTYSHQSPTSVFCSPYPGIVPDANVEPQPRNIDTFYYIDKTIGFLGDIMKQVDYMNKIRKRNIRTSEMKISDFEESKSNNVQSNSSINFINNNDVGPNVIRTQIMNSHGSLNQNNNMQIQLNSNDYELLFHCSQLIPIMDRTGRLLSDISLHLSHLLINHNLYPQLLLGNNQYDGFSDNLSCTSGYSIYTNEGSIVSGLINAQPTESTSGLQRSNVTTQSIQNSNQFINNYTNLLQNSSLSHSNTTSTVTLNTNTNNAITTSNSSSNIKEPQQTSTSGGSTTINSSLSGVMSGTTTNPNSQSANMTDNAQTQNTLNMQNTATQRSELLPNTTNTGTLPKIDLQVPAMLSMAEVALINGYNYNESNIDIYVHTIAAPIRQTQTTVSTSSATSNTATSQQQSRSAQETLSNINFNNLTGVLSGGNGQSSSRSNRRRVIELNQTLRNQPSPRTNTSNINNILNNMGSITGIHNTQSNNQGRTGLGNSANNASNANNTSATNPTSQNYSFLDSIYNFFSRSSQTLASQNNTAPSQTNTSPNNQPPFNQASSTSNTTLQNSNTNINFNISPNVNSSPTQSSGSRSNVASTSNFANMSSTNQNRLDVEIPNRSNYNEQILSNNLRETGGNSFKYSRETQTEALGGDDNNLLSNSDAKSDIYKKFYTKSLKSVSDVSDLDQIHDDDHSDTKSNKKLDRNDLKSVKSSTLSKLNEQDEYYSDQDENLNLLGNVTSSNNQSLANNAVNANIAASSDTAISDKNPNKDKDEINISDETLPEKVVNDTQNKEEDI